MSAYRRCALPLLLAVIAACGERSPSGPGAIVQSATIVGSATRTGAVAAAVDTLTIVALDSRGAPAAGAPVNWTTSDAGSSIAPVAGVTDATGRARAVWTLGTNAGAQSVVASVGSLTLTFTAEAEPGPAAAISVDQAPLTMDRGTSELLVAHARDQYGNIRLSAGITWSSVDTDVATVDPTGRLTGVIPGNTHIEATHGDITVAVAVTVVPVQFVAIATSLADPTGPHDGAGWTCAISRTGRAWCWGRGSAVPAVVPGPRMTRIAVGAAHACGVSGAGGFCWGANDHGQLAAPALVATDSAIRVIHPPLMLEVVAGSRHSCALDAAGWPHCWGSASNGQLGFGSVASSQLPAPMWNAGALDSISAGGLHTCGIRRSSQLVCAGGSSHGQTSWTVDAPTMIAVRGLTAVAAVTAGYVHTCALAADRSALCWGSAGDGRLGHPPHALQSSCPAYPGALCITTPTAVQGGRAFSALRAGGAHTCGLSQGQMYCWGDNSSGQLGSGVDEPRASAIPVLVSGGASFTRIAAGTRHTCAIVADGDAYCWGDNAAGQLGNGSFDSSPSPVRVRVD